MNIIQSLTFAPVIPWWMVGLFLATTIFLSSMRPGFGNLSSGRRTALMVLRVLAAVLLVFAIIRPGMIRNDFRKQNATVLVNLDISKSMSLPADDKKSRYSAAKELLQKIKDREPEFDEKGIELKLYGFDLEPNPINYFGSKPGGTNSEKQPLPKKVEGRQSDIISSVAQTVRSNLNKRVMGVVLLTDGTQNVTQPKSTAMDVGQVLQSKNIALHPIILGKVTNAGSFSDAAVTALPDSLAGFAGNEVDFRATVRLQGFQGRKVPVQLQVEKPDGTKSIVDTKIVDVENNNFLKAVDFQYLPETEGEYKVYVKIPGQPRESILANNQLKSYLQAFPGGLRVLYVTGNLQFEHKFIVRSLQASQDINVVTSWEDSRQRDRWPVVDYAEKFADKTVDVFVLDNIDADALWSPRFQTALKVLEHNVQINGKGLLMIGGFHSFGPGGYAGTPISRMLPVRIHASERQRFEQPLRTDTQLEGPVKLIEKRDHFITRLESNNQNFLGWESLPKLLGGNEFSKRDLKPSALTLLESENGDPLLVAGNYGGRVLAFAGDSTYLWVRHGFRLQHQKFWRQVMLWLASRDTDTSKAIWMKLSKRRLNLGEGLAVHAGVRDNSGDRINGVRLKASLIDPNGERTTIAFSQDPSQKQFNAELGQNQMPIGGSYQLEITATIDGVVAGTEVQEFEVKDIDNEIIQAFSDPTLVRQMTESSVDAGSQIWEGNQIDSLIDKLLNQAKTLQIKIPRLWRFGDRFSDAGTVLLLFFCVLMTEWYLRKKWGLV